jgi:CheY-like chemotaxis protein
MTIRLLVVDDHAVVRSGLKMLLENERDVEIIGEASSAAEAMEAAIRLKPNVILMDIGLPDLSGIDATREIKKRVSDASIVALTIHEDEEYFFKMLEAGAETGCPRRIAHCYPGRRHRTGLSLPLARETARARLSGRWPGWRGTTFLWPDRPRTGSAHLSGGGSK